MKMAIVQIIFKSEYGQRAVSWTAMGKCWVKAEAELNAPSLHRGLLHFSLKCVPLSLKLYLHCYTTLSISLDWLFPSSRMNQFKSDISCSKILHDRDKRTQDIGDYLIHYYSRGWTGRWAARLYHDCHGQTLCFPPTL